MAEVALARGAAATSARLVGGAAACRERAAAQATEAEVRQLADLDQRLDRLLGRSAAQRERHAGRTMSPAAAVALAVEMAAVGPEDADGAVVVLTPRQQEVAIQIAAGRTNRQIGTALGISEKTAEVHVHNIMERLDVPSRAGVAAWAATRGLTPPTSP
jgi:non-specific serine/threonine protein kinase